MKNFIVFTVIVAIPIFSYIGYVGIAIVLFVLLILFLGEEPKKFSRSEKPVIQIIVSRVFIFAIRNKNAIINFTWPYRLTVRTSAFQAGNSGSIPGRVTFSTKGDVAEWLNAPVSKTGIPKGIGGSNPPISAKILNSNFHQKIWSARSAVCSAFPHKILILQGFATLRVAQKVRFDP